MRIPRNTAAPRNSRGFIATFLVLLIAVLLTALTVVNTSTARRARRETQLLDARHQRQWTRRGVQPDSGPAPHPTPAAVDRSHTQATPP